MEILRGSQWERERDLGKVGRMDTVRSSICQKTSQTEKGATALAIELFRDYLMAKYMYMHINTHSSEVCSSKLWELGRFSLSVFCCRSVWICKLVAVRAAVLDTSGPMATDCADVVSAEAKERPEGHPPHVARCTTMASSRTCRGWGFPRLDWLRPWTYNITLANKKRPLRLCVKSEHCSYHTISRDCLGGAACRDFAHRCTEAQSSLIFRYPMIGTVFWFYA